MVAKSIAKIYTNIHKPTDYSCIYFLNFSSFVYDYVQVVSGPKSELCIFVAPPWGF